MNVSASLRLFGGVRPLSRRVTASLANLGLSANLAIAPTAGGAQLLARGPVRSPRRALQLSTLVRRLDALPCSCLPAALPHLAWLEGIGCARLGQLRRLPRAGLQRRTHAEVLRSLDAAYGQAPELFDWIVPPPEFHGRIELSEHIEYAQALQFIARRLIERLCGWLAARHLALTRLTFLLEHERGRQARAPTPVEVALGVPTWQSEPLMRLLQERLQRIELPAPVIAVTLEVLDTEARAPVPDALFPDPGGNAADRRHILDLLIARLGRENVLHASPLEDHRPEIANRWVPIDEKPSPPCYAPGAERPLWLLERPLALPVRDHRPVYGSPLRILCGPERIEDGWWSGLALRDYFVAEDTAHARYWLFQERGKHSGWFLHGFFG
jgi:protein ImuB